MALDLHEVVIDEDLGTCWSILRSQGSFVAGGWQQQKEWVVPAFGVIGIADEKALAQFPEGDRVKGSLIVITDQPMYPTLADRAGVAAISDLILWEGHKHRIQATQPWSMDGYWVAIAVRMLGD